MSGDVTGFLFEANDENRESATVAPVFAGGFDPSNPVHRLMHDVYPILQAGMSFVTGVPVSTMPGNASLEVQREYIRDYEKRLEEGGFVRPADGGEL